VPRSRLGTKRPDRPARVDSMTRLIRLREWVFREIARGRPWLTVAIMCPRDLHEGCAQGGITTLVQIRWCSAPTLDPLCCLGLCPYPPRVRFFKRFNFRQIALEALRQIFAFRKVESGIAAEGVVDAIRLANRERLHARTHLRSRE
jgi:hypothetical protein